MPKPVLLRRPRPVSTERVTLMDDSRLHDFITSFGDEEQRSVREFWRAYSTRRTLIDFGADTNTGRFPRYGYNLNRQTYFYVNRSGRRVVVPNSSIKLEVERY